MMRKNAGRTLSRYKKSKKSLKGLKTLPLQVGRYKALAPAFDSSLGRVVYGVRYGRKTKTFFSAENQAIFMQRRAIEEELNKKHHDYLYTMFEKQAKEQEKVKAEREKARRAREKEKAAKAKKEKKKNPKSKEEQFMEFLRNPFEEIFEDEEYDLAPRRRR